MSYYLFKETQSFRKIWIWIVLIGATAISIWGMFFTESSKPAEGWEKAIPLGILLSINSLFLSLKLKTRIDSQSLSFSYSPFISERKYWFEDIQSMDLIENNSLLKYGGWGIRYNWDSWAYNTGGRFGIMIKTKDKKFLLGTHKPKEVQKALEKYKEFKSQSNGN